MTATSAGREPVLVGPSTFELVPGPSRQLQPGPGQAVVRVLAGGICGSDIPFFRGAPVPPWAGTGGGPAPGYPMHEIVGVVEAVGPDSDGAPSLGSTVVGWAVHFDGMANQVLTDVEGLLAIPDSWAPEDAVLLQPLACVLYAVERLGDVSGKHCAVLGLGPIGLLFCHVLKQRGAACVTGVDRIDRSAVAEAFGIDDLHWATTETWLAGVGARRPQVIIEAIGHQPGILEHALDAVADCGLLFYFGMNDQPIYPLNMDLLLRKSLTLMSGTTQERTRVLQSARDYLDRHPALARHVITHRFGRSQAQAAYQAAALAAPDRLKVVMTMDA